MKDFFDTWKFKILVIVAVFLVGIMAYAGANGRLTAAPQGARPRPQAGVCRFWGQGSLTRGSALSASSADNAGKHG